MLATCYVMVKSVECVGQSKSSHLSCFAKVFSLYQIGLSYQLTSLALSNFTSCQFGPSNIIKKQLHMPFLGPQSLIEKPCPICLYIHTYICLHCINHKLNKYLMLSHYMYTHLLFTVVYQTIQTRS